MDTNKEKIRRFTSDKFSFEDYSSVVSCFQKDVPSGDLQKCLEEDWNSIKIDDSNDERLSHVLDKLHHQINLGKSIKASIIRSLYLKVSKIAVILLIPALITIAFLSYLTIQNSKVSDSWVEIHTPVGTRTAFQLPDGSKGWLNSGSSIKYPVNFMAQREVKISGEAWFDVVHMKFKDFRVITPNFTVKVLGTQFNVVAYKNEPTEEVILERGKVLVLGINDRSVCELVPDQHLIFNKATKKISKTPIDSKSYSGWKDGLMNFKNVPMSEIALRLERRYGAKIILHGDSLKNSIFRATFEDESLDEICKLLSEVSPVRYLIHKRAFLTDSTFTKREVEMWLKTNKSN